MSNPTFSVTLINESKGLKETVQVADEEYILDVAEAQDINLPYSCRAGSCFDCLGKVVDGEVQQTGHASSFLKPDEIEAGYVLLCCCSATSNCTIVTHQAEEYLG